MAIIKEKYDSFRGWQKQPHHVLPLSDEEHDCATCGTHYQGNFCPRCGQSAKVGRYSFKKAFLLFIDVWGLGNRGMFRTIRDLVLRPGYMIRDYLSGMQMAYFPPFKMFFLLMALSLLVSSGLNIRMENRMKKNKDSFERGFSRSQIQDENGIKIDWKHDNQTDVEGDEVELSPEEEEEVNEAEEKIDHIAQKVMTFISKDLYEWVYKNLTFIMLVGLLVISGPLYLMFRHSPSIPGMRYSEFFVAMLYSTNMLMIYLIVASILCITEIRGLHIFLLAIIPLKQFSGYSWLQTIWRAAVGLFIFFFFALLFVIGIGFAVGCYFASMY